MDVKADNLRLIFWWVGFDSEHCTLGERGGGGGGGAEGAKHNIIYTFCSN